VISIVIIICGVCSGRQSTTERCERPEYAAFLPFANRPGTATCGRLRTYTFRRKP